MAFSRAKASSERMEEVLLANEDWKFIYRKVRDCGSNEGDLRFENVSFMYPGKPEPILDNVSFHVSPGEKLAIMGATGSGKSTLLNLIPRIFEATEGKIYVSGTEVKDWALKDLRDTIGLVPQQSILFTGSILENLSWGDTEADVDELEEAAKKAQIHESIDLFPLKIWNTGRAERCQLIGWSKTAIIHCAGARPETFHPNSRRQHKCT